MKFLTLIIFCFTAFYTFAQSSSPDCSTFRFGDFIKDNPKDSIYVYREYADWYEMNVTKGYRNVFSIIWTDDCNFSLILNNCSAKDSSIKNNYCHDTLFYKALKSSPTSLTFEVKDRNKTYQETLSTQPGLDVWSYMLNRYNSLKEDTDFSHGPTELLPDSIRKSRSEMAKQMRNAGLNLPEIKQVEYVLSLLKKEDITPLYSMASEKFKSIAPFTLLKDYNLYLQNTYGQLKNYKLFSSPLNIDMSKLGIGSPFPVDNESTYTFDASFEKMKYARITIKLEKTDSIYRVEAVNVETEKNERVPFIDRLTQKFWSLLKSNNFKKIYNTSSELLKNQASLSQIRNMLSLIKSYGEIDNYTLYLQNFEVDNDKGVVSAEYMMNKDNKNAILKLSYVFENGDYHLAGIHYNQK